MLPSDIAAAFSPVGSEYASTPSGASLALPTAASGQQRAGYNATEFNTVARVWRAVGQIPIIKRAAFVDPRADYANVQLETSDVDAGTRPIVERLVDLTTGRTLPAVPTAVHDAGQRPCFLSPSRNRALRFTNTSGEGSSGAVKWFVEVWRADGTLVAKAPASGIHGTPPQDSSIQNVAWSEDEKTVVYIAEKHRVKAPRVWTKTSDTDDNVDAQLAPFEHRPHWGEQYTEHSAMTLVKATLSGDKLILADCLSEEFSSDYSASCPIVTLDGSFAMFVGYYHHPRRLGIVHCSSRSTALFTLKLHSPPTGPRSEPLNRTFCRNVRTLTRHPTDDRVAALVAAENSDAHATCVSLVVLSGLRSGDRPLDVTTLVPVVDRPDKRHGSAAPFPGLYTRLNSDLAWVGPGHLLVNSSRRSQHILFVVDVAKPGQLVDLAEPLSTLGPLYTDPGFGTWRLHDTLGLRALVAHATAACPPSLYYCPDVTSSVPAWTKVLDGTALVPSRLAPFLARMATTLVRRSQPAGEAAVDTKDDAESFDTILSVARDDVCEAVLTRWNAKPPALTTDGGSGSISPAEGSPRAKLGTTSSASTSVEGTSGGDASRGATTSPGCPPATPGSPKPSRTIVLLHGGPHSVDTCNFTRTDLLALLCGFNVFSVNYGGSLGFGQHAIDELGGRAGSSDVRDVMQMVRLAQGRGLLPTRRGSLVVCGGSHGGFLSAHLTGQCPTVFSAATMRNPVINIASMLHETDIPDWCLFEAGFAVSDPTKAFNASPICHAAKVTTPTLIGLGLGDQRVPPPQGMGWYHALRGNRVCPEVRLMEYPGNGHALDGVEAEADYAIMNVLFLTKYADAVAE